MPSLGSFIFFLSSLYVVAGQWLPANSQLSSAKIKINPKKIRAPVPAPAPTPQTVDMGVISMAMPTQNQDVWRALDTMRGHQQLRSDELTTIMMTATPGVDYPALSTIPDNPFFNCGAVNQPGFYADPTAQCQVFRRCDQDGNLFSYLCPNTTIFNQITLTCDYFYNVDCSKASMYYDYANSRLYHEGWPLLGNTY